MIRLPHSLADLSSFRDGIKPPWRWLAAGVGAGIVLGAVGARVLTRGRRDADSEPVDQADDHVDGEKGDRSETSLTTPASQKRTAVAARTVNGWTKTAIHRASDTSAHATAKVRGVLGHRDPQPEPAPTGEPQDSTEDPPQSAVNHRDS